MTYDINEEWENFISSDYVEDNDISDTTKSNLIFIGGWKDFMLN